MDNIDFNAKENTSSNNNDIYFSNHVDSDSNNAKKTNVATKQSTTATKTKKPKKGKGVGSTYLFFIFVIVASMLISVYAIFCMNDVLAITKTKSSVTVSLKEEVETSDDAIDILYDAGLIKCKNFCKFFANYRKRYVCGPYSPGVYYLNGKMGLEGMLVTLQGNSDTTETVRLSFPEGYTVPEIIDKLAENDVCDKASLLAIIQSSEFSYPLVADLTASEEVPYRLEGYLFPDTYDFYIGESASSVIRKFLENGDSKFTEKYKKRMDKLGLTYSDVITIASIIQMEAANDEQMKTISAILHNRLNDTTNTYQALQCNSTSDYITKKVASSLSSTSAHTADYYLNYYNTYNFNGLPAGPICNPGKAAIEAALYPSDCDDYFFFHDTDGNLYTAKTYSEFTSKVRQYAPYLIS